jgi:WD40 repeat protein
MQMSKDSVMFLSIGLFKLLDTDENGLIDGLEFLSVLAMVSGMYKYEILEFIFALYDFSNAASLNFDEVVLAIKNTTNGLLKLQNEDESMSILSLPTDLLVEELVIKLFSSLNVSQEGLWNARIEIRTLAANSLLIPEISNWIDYFNDFAYEEESKKFQTCDRLDIMRLRTYDDVCTNSILKFERMKFIRQVNQTYQWKSQVALLTPIEYANIALPKSSPPTEFSLEWVYGLETNRTLRHINYTKNDEIMYFVGNQVCIYSPQMNTQRSRSYHGTDICALQISREHNLFAVGNVGLDPTIFVCDVDTMQILGELNLVGSNDAFDINFSHDGSTLLIVDNSERKIVTVWDYQTKTILFKDLLSKGIIFSSAVLLKDKYVISQDNHIIFWIKGEEGYLKREGVWVKNKKPEALSVVLCTSFGDNLVGGTVHGALVLFHGYTCVKYITAHTGPVTALISCSEGYLTGSKDSRIRMWSSNLEPKFLFDISKFSAFPCITSLSLSSDSSVIMFSTIACEVFEISALDGSDVRGGPVVQGHRFGDINDLDTHPSKLEAVTVGSDRTLRVFDLSLKGQIKLANLGFEGTTVAYSPLGDTIAVGAACVQGHDYKFAILSEESLAILHIARDNNSVVTVLKYSTDGELLAVGCSDGGIYLYSIPDEYDLVCKCVRHNRPICGIDFSKEGEWLRSNSVDGELHFFSADDGSYQSNLSSMRDIAWSSQDCIYSWHSKGIHSGSSISEEFPVVSSVSNEEAPSILVTGTSMGSLRAYTYPCVEDTAEFQHFYAHTARIAKVKFSFDNSLLLSVGTKDRTVLQFKLNRKGLVVRDPTPTPAFIETMYEVSTDSEREIFSVSTLSDWGKQKDNVQFDWDKFLVGKQVKEDLQFHSLPPVTLMLERVYGYEASRILGNIQYLSDSEIFYTAGNFGIILNRVNETQRIYQVSCYNFNT